MAIIDLKEVRIIIERTDDNLQKINELTKSYEEDLEILINKFLQTGKAISEESLGAGYLTSINQLTLVPWKPLKQKIVSNINYLRSNPDRLFFISSKAITEVYLEDTLPVTEHYSLIDNNEKDFTIELTFKSTRQRNREKFIYGNKYRFVWSWYKNEMTIRKLEE